MKELIQKLETTQTLSFDEWIALINGRTEALSEFLFERARFVSTQHYGHDIFVRGLIEFTNYCRNDCYYCGIRRSNANVRRYRLTKEEILSCCRTGYELGFRTFVLQGGEDAWYTDEKMADIISSIKAIYPDCAITLSIGEKSVVSYELFYKYGADRYLLRHETCNALHYASLHPAPLSAANRQQCLRELRRIGYQVGSGFMVGSPGQTAAHLAEDMLFLKELNPHMVGIGPFIPHHDTPFAQELPGTLELTLFMLGLLRLMLPTTLLPSTTALGTIAPDGRELGILAGANVVMPNLSPVANRKDYSLYDNKICTGDEAAECRKCLEKRMERIGYRIVTARGDSLVGSPK
ncbi:[FeFe] hydrogenase H-cluster radical SAM maturase HydE [Bariatricus massiliensis]|uniref:[FeFe] hydrogenase H-cluster radical SAM maturase HydE n=1 Tax=Bariatricus massiliensis TaxID=1745713 RepID=A0ABS8DI63_9FIRM|nr:[FeFe] hydrogenase H-cluster radical SAM maturase HydE [Bariatricus massiliensis]MCB7304613.1 [FeFe] hydrogenase H-cluster radical SAM maturase HydE [Bariatricus massiliensis]MCB7374764.1 [FeFe] hydrogenase H-cluster radical SAM maturase HydE [Bariatricus massiliensis]MCB7388109.1 [FeFe] hydrogenase H-cluster radical SAM maturase HydE [Bariatricus massiliensis]MCB7411929.1 [FeFe] hydrogenase H-cluster radical SAM maturase HydE [Bariatricus massiliensis]MCQ5254280.1 [FeFe] hydrogenase H-clus